jgi:hypothetical protein
MLELLDRLKGQAISMGTFAFNRRVWFEKRQRGDFPNSPETGQTVKHAFE